MKSRRRSHALVSGLRCSLNVAHSRRNLEYRCIREWVTSLSHKLNKLYRSSPYHVQEYGGGIRDMLARDRKENATDTLLPNPQAKATTQKRCLRSDCSATSLRSHPTIIPSSFVQDARSRAPKRKLRIFPSLLTKMCDKNSTRNRRSAATNE